jgi:hypothetical protein
MRAVALLLAAHALVACAYDQQLGDINCAANPRIELVAYKPWAGLGPSSLRSDGTNLYWLNMADMAWTGPWKASLGGGDPIQLSLGQEITGENGIAVDASTVYWTYLEGVMSIPIGGGTPTPIATTSQPGGVALDATNVYWTSLSEGSVMTTPIGGEGEATVLASGQSEPAAIAVDAANVYWRNRGDGAIKKVPIGGGGETLLAAGQAGSIGMAVAGAHVYWTNGDDGTVMKAPTSGGGPTTLASGQPGAGAIATDGTTVYFTAAGALRRVPAGGGAPVTLECGHGAGVVALDATHVYWSNDEGIVRHPR